MKQTSRALAALLAIAIGATLVSACGEDSEQGSNHLPNIATLFVVPENPAPNGSAQVRYDVLDVDGDAVSIRWEAEVGEVVRRDGALWWDIPDVEGTFRITVIASDGIATDRRSVDVLVWRPRPGNYYPLAVGNEWHYEDPAGNAIAFRMIDTLEIQDTEITSYVLETETSDPGVPEGVVNYSYVGRAEGEIQQHGVNVIFGSPETLIFQPWLPLYRWPLIPGKSWRTDFRGKLPDGFFIGEGTASYKVVDESTVTTPAGTFEHVVQVEETFEWHLAGQQLDRTVSRKWLAPDVGIVQIDQEQTRGEQTQQIFAQLTEYSLKPDTSFDLIPPSQAAPLALR